MTSNKPIDPRNAFLIEVVMHTEDARKILDPERVRFAVGEGIEALNLNEEIDVTISVQRSVAAPALPDVAEGEMNQVRRFVMLAVSEADCIELCSRFGIINRAQTTNAEMSDLHNTADAAWIDAAIRLGYQPAGAGEQRGETPTCYVQHHLGVPIGANAIGGSSDCKCVPQEAQQRGETPKPLCKCGHTFFMHDGGELEGCDESNGQDFCGCKKYDPVPDKYWCQACRDTGLIHCSDPENCGGMLKNGEPIYPRGSQETQPLPARPNFQNFFLGYGNSFDIIKGCQSYIEALKAELSRLTGEPDGIGWCSSCDRMHEVARPKCPKCGDWLVFAADDAAKEEQGGWIDCKQELPNVGQKVLVWHIKAEAEHIARYQPLMDPVFPWRDSFNGGDGPSVTHWQPLPTPPDSKEGLR